MKEDNTLECPNCGNTKDNDVNNNWTDCFDNLWTDCPDCKNAWRITSQ